MIVIGIDPGKKGAIVIVDTETDDVRFLNMPLICEGESMTYRQAQYRDSKLPKTKRHYIKDLTVDVEAVAEFVSRHSPDYVIIEQLEFFGARTGIVEKVNEYFRLGMGAGQACQLHPFVWIIAPSKEWTANYPKAKKPNETKKLRIAYCRDELGWPVENDGQADAALMAHWCMTEAT